MKAIFLGDPHIGKNVSQGKTTLGGNLNSRIVDQINLLDWVLDRALDHNVDHIIITGDIWEEVRPAPYLITIFISWLKKCQTHCVNVHIIMGNHDILRSGFYHTSTLDILIEADMDKIHVYKNINTIIIGTSAITLMPFRDRKSFAVNSNLEAINIIHNSLTYELSSIPITYNKVVLGHLAINGSLPIGDEVDDIANELFCPIDMFNGYDYVWMGHIHRPQIMNKKYPYIAHIGSMDISNFGETDQKKHIVIFNCMTGEWETEYLPTRSLKKINITIPKGTDNSTDYVLNELEKDDLLDKSIVRLEVILSSPEILPIDKTVVEKFLHSKGVSNISSMTESKKLMLVKKDVNNTIDTKMDIATSIKTYADKYIDDNFRPSFIELSMDIFNQYKIEVKE